MPRSIARSRVKVPSYDRYRSSAPTASKVMRSNRAKNTRPEVALRSVLSVRGLRFRTHSSHLPGRPDIVFNTQRLAVFCDGDFWHGRNWKKRKGVLAAGANASYWVRKIESNRVRDRRQSARLRRLGWVVIRFWEGEILSDAERVASKIQEALDRIRPSLTHHRP